MADADRYDVVVVGGGPAGSMAARAAASRGAKTLLLERDPNIGVPVRCGEGVSLQHIERFFKPEESFIAARISGMVLYAPDGTGVLVRGNDIGVVLERALFDRWLAERAADAGADILTRADVDGLVGDGAVKGVTYTRYGRRRKVRAGVVIGADGVESRIGRWAGIRTQLSPADLESAYQMVLTGIEFDHHYCHFHFGNEVAPGGYVWIFPKGERTASVGIGTCAKDAGPGEAYRLLNDFIKRRFGRRPALVGEMAGGVPVARALKVPLTDGLLLAGDAARHCNPLTGGGIATAMFAGDHAGKTAAAAVDAGDVSAKGLRPYLKLVEEDIAAPHRRAYRIAVGVGKLSDETINWTAHEMLSMPQEDWSLRNIFIKALSSQPKLMVDVVKAFL